MINLYFNGLRHCCSRNYMDRKGLRYPYLGIAHGLFHWGRNLESGPSGHMGRLPTTAEGTSAWKANELAPQWPDCSNEPHTVWGLILRKAGRRPRCCFHRQSRCADYGLMVTGMPFTCWYSCVTGCWLESAPLGSLL